MKGEADGAFAGLKILGIITLLETSSGPGGDVL